MVSQKSGGAGLLQRQCPIQILFITTKSKVEAELIPLKKKKNKQRNKTLTGLFSYCGSHKVRAGLAVAEVGSRCSWDKVGPGLPAGVLAGVWDLSSSRREQRWKHISSDLEALSTGWRVDVFFACFGLVMGLWLGDAPVSGLPSTL